MFELLRFRIGEKLSMTLSTVAIRHVIALIRQKLSPAEREMLLLAENAQHTAGRLSA
jgi:hypothetical protein